VSGAPEPIEPALRLDRRQGWPETLRFLLRQYPREVWPGHQRLDSLAQFWLQRHAMLRALAGALRHASGELREGRVAAAPFRAWFAPRLGFFLDQLQGHHEIEDQHYFPLLMRLEPKLVRGFAVLENDHALIHAALARLDTQGAALVRATEAPLADLTGAAAGFAAESDGFLAQLARHLDDEEDLLIPLILDRGSDPLTDG
jgi:hemerythrin-like domain-containing protein